MLGGGAGKAWWGARGRTGGFTSDSLLGVPVLMGASEREHPTLDGGSGGQASSPLSVETPIWPLGPGPASVKLFQVLGLSATAPA